MLPHPPLSGCKDEVLFSIWGSLLSTYSMPSPGLSFYWTISFSHHNRPRRVPHSWRELLPC